MTLEPTDTPRFTRAELEVIDGVAKGWNPDVIAEWLGVTSGTVRVLISRVAHKLPEHGGLIGYNRVLYWTSARDALRDNLGSIAPSTAVKRKSAA